MNDYSKMLNLLENLNERKKILLHSCCGPCSSYVIIFLRKYFDITVLYYNPNIFPESEYLHRKAEQIKLIDILNKESIVDFIDCDYDYESYLKFVNKEPFIKEGGLHCYNCYLYRMEYTAKKAAELNYDYFTTTLSVSPHKNSDYINEIGGCLESKYQMKYLFSNFKKQEGYKKSIELSKKYNLYRQDYCGCAYSLKERSDSNESK